MNAKFEIRHAQLTMEGAGAEVARLMPIPGFMNFDPFVLWDHFRIDAKAGFPDHPHRGFEAITYLFDGAIEHADNLGNRSVVTTGGAQRFTAGRGLVHSEMPHGEGITRGIQLWINLPGRLKNIAPSYQQIDAPDIPEQILDKGSVRVIVGDGSALQLNTPVQYLDVQLAAGGEYWIPLTMKQRGIVYVVSGTGQIAGQKMAVNDAIFLEQTAEVRISADMESRFMVCFGEPHGEPIRQHGPFVD